MRRNALGNAVGNLIRTEISIHPLVVSKWGDTRKEAGLLMGYV